MAKKLHAKALDEGGLARGGRPGYQDQFASPAPPGDLVGYCHYLALVQDLSHPDYIADAAFNHGFVEVGDGLTASTQCHSLVSRETAKSQ